MQARCESTSPSNSGLCSKLLPFVDALPGYLLPDAGKSKSFADASESDSMEISRQRTEVSEIHAITRVRVTELQPCKLIRYRRENLRRSDRWRGHHRRIDCLRSGAAKFARRGIGPARAECAKPPGRLRKCSPPLRIVSRRFRWFRWGSRAWRRIPQFIGAVEDASGAAHRLSHGWRDRSDLPWRRGTRVEHARGAPPRTGARLRTAAARRSPKHGTCARTGCARGGDASRRMLIEPRALMSRCSPRRLPQARRCAPALK